MAFTLDDLMTECRACGGDGAVSNPAWDDLTDADDLPDFEAVYGPEEWECGECNGQGYIPTEAGRAIMDFVYRFMLRHRDGIVNSIRFGGSEE